MKVWCEITSSMFSFSIMDKVSKRPMRRHVVTSKLPYVPQANFAPSGMKCSLPHPQNVNLHIQKFLKLSELLVLF